LQGYALIEYSTLPEAREAIEKTNGTKLLDQTISADFAFVRPPPGPQGDRGRGGQRGGARGAGGRARPRSRSPGAERDEKREEEDGGDENIVDAPAPAKLADRITS
jgi:RNA-binding protein 8A